VDQEFQYGEGEDAAILKARVVMWSCDECGEQFTEGDAEIARHDAVCAHLGRLNPAELRTIREYLGYSQDAWANFTKIGVASIKRWETGGQIQNPALDQYIRLLQNPEAYKILLGHSVSPSQATPQFRTPLTEGVRQRARLFELRLEHEK